MQLRLTCKLFSKLHQTILEQWLNSTSKYKGKLPQALLMLIQDTGIIRILTVTTLYFPGSMSVTMTLIGILLTALVIAREWERGTMEALLTTKITKMQLVLGKYIPYFCVGMLSMSLAFLCVSMCFNILLEVAY